jgi:ABC-type glycerol-3-phosphate transport system permease component
LYAITYWNNYFHVMMYTNSTEMRTIQLYLYDIINNGQAFAENLYSGWNSGGASISSNVTTDGMVAAAVTMSLVPIVLMYPSSSATWCRDHDRVRQGVRQPGATGKSWPRHAPEIY